jgi:hypothetical protein
MEWMTQLAIAVIVVVFAAAVAPWLKGKIALQEQDILAKWAMLAVEAAEQIYDGMKGSGESKNEFAKAFLQERVVGVDEKMIDTALEAAVYLMKSAWGNRGAER